VKAVGIRHALVVAAVAACASGIGPTGTAQSSSVTPLLDRYLAGDYDGVVAVLDAPADFDDILKALQRDGPEWIASAPGEARDRRRLAAATFALEAARAGEWIEWKQRRLVPYYLFYQDERGAWHYPEVLTWDAPPLLIEWGCRLLRDAGSPGDVERLWQLAALAVAQRSEDAEFQRSDGIVDIYNPKVEIDHLFHVRQRFPSEPRFVLGEAILQEWRRPQIARRLLEDQVDDPDIGAEATMRLAAIALRQREDDRAIELGGRVERLTRDPWLLYLSRYIKAQALDHKRRPADAERAYRAALAARPAAQTASLSLASLLFGQERRREAAAVVATMLDAKPAAVDPWREYVHADDRFWPLLIRRIRLELQP